MLKEFKEFALKGSALDLAVGVIIGAGFGKIVTSLVDDIIMPPLGLVLGRVDFSNMFVNLSGQAVTSVAEAKKAGIPVLAYGLFLNAVVQFFILAFVVFLMVRQINRLKREPETQPDPVTRECPFCASTIAIKATRCPQCTSEVPVPMATV